MVEASGFRYVEFRVSGFIHRKCPVDNQKCRIEAWTEKVESGYTDGSYSFK